MIAFWKTSWCFWFSRLQSKTGLIVFLRKNSSKIECCVCYALVYEVKLVVTDKVGFWQLDLFFKHFSVSRAISISIPAAIEEVWLESSITRKKFQIGTSKQELKSQVWDLSGGLSKSVHTKSKSIAPSNYHSSNTTKEINAFPRKNVLRLKLIQ